MKNAPKSEILAKNEEFGIFLENWGALKIEYFIQGAAKSAWHYQMNGIIQHVPTYLPIRNAKIGVFTEIGHICLLVAYLHAGANFTGIIIIAPELATAADCQLGGENE